MLTKPQRRVLLLSSLGGILEFYDFIIYALLAQYLTDQFFPTGNPVTSLLAAFATFALGYIVRPLGGIIFGHFGDKYGRKRTFTISILMMALSTLLIAFIPSYAAIGITAPIILTFLRICQGLSIGGEIPGAIAYVSESIHHRKGFSVGVIFCCLLLGMVIGALFQSILSSILEPKQMEEWGWRVLFFIGGFFGLISYRLRKELEESQIFQAIAKSVVRLPLLEVFSNSLLNTLAGVFLIALTSSTITLLFLFMPAYLSEVLHHEFAAFDWAKTVAMFISSILCIVFGYLADKTNPRKLVFILVILTIGLIYPIFQIYHKAFSWYWVSLLLSAGLLGFAGGAIPPLLAELFPTHYRYSGIAVSYNISFAIFGGLTPVIAAGLIYATHNPLSPIYYLMGTALLALLGVMIMRQIKLK